MLGNNVPVWSPAEKAAWAPPLDISVSEWAARHRVLPKASAIPGLWSNRLGPYAVGVMDAFNDPRVERITIMASVQSMKTEAVYNMLAWAIDQDPAPALIVMPTLNTMKRVNRRIRKMLWASPQLSGHLTGNPDDLQIHQITLDRMEIYFATAGSEADLQNVEARYILGDETDEYPETGDEGDPMEKAVDRSTTFWNRKIMELSRPTAASGYITKSYEASDRRKYWVPCPWCGGYQVLLFKQLKHLGEIRGEWPDREVLVEQKGGVRRFNSRSPEYIKLARVARYECEHCAGEIDDRHKPEMLARGRWLPGRWLPWDADSPLDHYREVAQSSYVASHAGFWWNVLYSPFRNFSEVAAQFFKVRKNPKKFQIFINQWLAEPWKEVVQQRQPSQILQLRTARPALAVPEDALALTAGIDSQRRGFWIVIRAWVLTADGLRESHKIRHGWVATFGEVEQWVFQDVYRTAGGIEHRVWRGFIDTGGGLMGEGEATLTEQVYNWLRRSGRGRIFGSKGSSKPLSAGRLAHQGQPIDHYPSGKPLPGGLALWLLDTQALKDFIWARIENGLFHLDGGPDLSFEEDQIPENDKIYAAHLAAEIKERNKQGKLVWTAKPGRANHLLDCEVMAAGAAEAFNVWLLPRPRAAGETANGNDREINPLTGKARGTFWRR